MLNALALRASTCGPCHLQHSGLNECTEAARNMVPYLQRQLFLGIQALFFCLKKSILVYYFAAFLSPSFLIRLYKDPTDRS